MRAWVSEKTRRWAMFCDECGHHSDERATQNDLPLAEFAASGWFVAAKSGDLCPTCRRTKGVVGREPHGVMTLSATDPYLERS